MPIDFDENDLDEAIEQTEQDVAEAPTEDDVEQQMSEVEARLEMAQYYRLLLNDSIFQDPPNPEVAQRVEEEIRGFIRSRMGILVGVGAPEKPKEREMISVAEDRLLRELATPEIVQTVKSLVSKLLKKPSIMEPRPPPKGPPEEPKLQPKVVKTPTLRKVTNPKGESIGSAGPRQETARAPEPAVGPSQRRVASKPKGQQKRVVQTFTKADGTVFTQDITPPATPVGPIQPIPTPTSREGIEQQMASASAAHDRAAQKMLDRKLRTGGDD